MSVRVTLLFNVSENPLYLIAMHTSMSDPETETYSGALVHRAHVKGWTSHTTILPLCRERGLSQSHSIFSQTVSGAISQETFAILTPASHIN